MCLVCGHHLNQKGWLFWPCPCLCLLLTWTETAGKPGLCATFLSDVTSYRKNKTTDYLTPTRVWLWCHNENIKESCQHHWSSSVPLTKTISLVILSRARQPTDQVLVKRVKCIHWNIANEYLLSHRFSNVLWQCFSTRMYILWWKKNVTYNTSYFSRASLKGPIETGLLLLCKM